MSCRYSVVMPVRDGAAYVHEALASVLAQTVRDLEVVVLDNQSRDGTRDIVAALARQDSRLRLVESPRALSIEDSWARIHELCEARAIAGEYLTLIGHDDRLLPGFLEVIGGLIERHPAATLYQTHFRVIDTAGRVTRHCRPMPCRENASDFFLSRCWALRDSFGTGQVFRQDAYRRCGGIPSYPRLLFSDDMLWLRLLRNGERVTAAEIGFEYRLHTASASAENTASRHEALLAALQAFVADIDRTMPELLASEIGRAGLKMLITNELKGAQKASYRAGIPPAAIAGSWRALAARHAELARGLGEPADIPPEPRYRPIKRSLHTLRRGLAALGIGRAG